MLPSLAPLVPACAPRLLPLQLCAEHLMLLLEAFTSIRRVPPNQALSKLCVPSSDVAIAARPLSVSFRSAPSIPHGKTNGLPPPVAAISLGPRALLACRSLSSSLRSTLSCHCHVSHGHDGLPPPSVLPLAPRGFDCLSLRCRDKSPMWPDIRRCGPICRTHREYDTYSCC